ncbi:MAG TPA: YIP1 family protein [Streptosporangiaceae bacterium]|nr:YIP1 family protein [Streptosporangiaceae bacterium]
MGTDTLNVPGLTLQYGLPIDSIPYYVFQSIIQNQQNQMQASGGGGVGALDVNPRFVSIGTDQAGIITALDQLTDFVFQYGSEGQLLYTFGGIDNGNGVLGLFQDPTAVAVTTDGYVVVSDGLEENVQVFQPTTFATLAQQAVELYAQGQYKQAEAPWQQILAMDSNYDLAHAQLGEGFLSEGELLGSSPAVLPQELQFFSKSIQQFYLANDKPDFGVAFGWYRHIWMRVNFTWIFLSFLGAWLCVYLAWRLLGRRIRERPVAFEGAWVRNQFVRVVPMAWRMIKHPAEAFFQLKYEGQGTLWQGITLIVFAFLVHLGNLVWTNFDFSRIERGQTNLFTNSSEFLLPLVTWIVANYLVGDVYEGEANLPEVLTGSAYAMLPFIVLQLPYALFTHALVPTDGVFRFLDLVQRVWTVYLFFTQVRVLHNLEWGTAIRASVMTLVGIGVIWTMFLIVTGLGQQAYQFIRQIISEILLLRS